MKQVLITAIVAMFVGVCDANAQESHPEPQVKTGPGNYILCAANRVVFRIHVKTGQTYATEHREWKAILEEEAIPEGEYDLLMTHARSVMEIFRIEKKTGATWGVGYSDSDPKREKPRWFRIGETPFPPPLDKKST